MPYRNLAVASKKKKGSASPGQVRACAIARAYKANNEQREHVTGDSGNARSSSPASFPATSSLAASDGATSSNVGSVVPSPSPSPSLPPPPPPSPEPMTLYRIRGDQYAPRQVICLTYVRSLAARNGDGVCRDYLAGENCLRCYRQSKHCDPAKGRVLELAIALMEAERSGGRVSLGANRLYRKLNDLLRAEDAGTVVGPEGGDGLLAWVLVVVILLLLALVAFLLSALGAKVVVKPTRSL